MTRGVLTIKPHYWTKEEKEYLKKVTPGHHHNEIQELVNKKFNLNLTTGQIKAALNRYKLNTGFTGRFKKGNTPFNKGKNMKKYLSEEALKGMAKTQFRKGQAPVNWRPVGSERLSKDGYVEIKIAEPNKWRFKHLVVWEKEHGPVLKGHAVIFLDRDKTNISIDNLKMVTRNELMIMNRHKLFNEDKELTNTGTIIAKVIAKTNERKKKVNGKD